MHILILQYTYIINNVLSDVLYKILKGIEAHSTDNTVAAVLMNMLY